MMNSSDKKNLQIHDYFSQNDLKQCERKMCDFFWKKVWLVGNPNLPLTQANPHE